MMVKGRHMINNFSNREKGTFDTDVAVEHGVDAAVVIEQFGVWVRFNLYQDRAIRQGRCWTCHTLEGLVRSFPWLDQGKVKRLMIQLVESDVLIKGPPPIDPSELTRWYAFSDQYAALFGLGVTAVQDGDGRPKSAAKVAAPEPVKLTAEQAEWVARAEHYADPFPDPRLITPAQLASRRLPNGFQIDVLQKMLFQCGPLYVPVCLWLDWSILKQIEPVTFNAELELLGKVSKGRGVSPAAVLLYSLERYRDSQAPTRQKTLCFPAGHSGKPSMGPASHRSRSAAKAAPTRRHVT